MVIKCVLNLPLSLLVLCAHAPHYRYSYHPNTLLYSCHHVQILVCVCVCVCVF